MQERRKLDVGTILEKDFKLSSIGYDPEEVDSFLDLVIADYFSFYEELELNKKTMGNHHKEVQDLKERIKKLEAQLTIKKAENEDINPDSYNNLDLIKKIAELQKEVHQLKTQIQLYRSK